MRCPLCRHVVPFDDAETIDLMLKNVERGDTAAMTQLGLYYRDGKMGLRVDLGRAASYYERAAALGHLGAMVDLGIACEGGRGVPRDAAAAAGWYRKAADGGHARATLNLGVLHAEGRGVRRDAAEAARLYALAAARGDAKARRTASREDVREIRGGNTMRHRYRHRPRTTSLWPTSPARASPRTSARPRGSSGSRRRAATTSRRGTSARCGGA